MTLNVFQQIFASVDSRTQSIMDLAENADEKQVSRKSVPKTPPETKVQSHCYRVPVCGKTMSPTATSPRRGIPLRETSSLVQQLRESPAKIAFRQSPKTVSQIKVSEPSSPVPRILDSQKTAQIKVSPKAPSSPTIGAMSLVEELEATLSDKRALIGQARTALSAARQRHTALEQKNTELEIVTQRLTDAIANLDERLVLAQADHQEREARCEAMWAARISAIQSELQSADHCP
jgi:hypothetical protein